MSEEIDTQLEFDPVAFREHEDHENRITFLVKLPAGVIILLVLAVMMNHWLINAFGPIDNVLLGIFDVVAFTALGMAWLGVTGQV